MQVTQGFIIKLFYPKNQLTDEKEETGEKNHEEKFQNMCVNCTLANDR